MTADAFKMIWPPGGAEPIPWDAYQDELDRHYRYGSNFSVRFMHRSRIRTFLKLFPSLEGKDVLEVGCAAGGYVVLSASMGAKRVWGVDVHEEGLRNARSWAAARAHDRRVAVGMASVERLPFDDASFDVVICTEVLEHVPDASAGIKEIARVLRPGG